MSELLRPKPRLGVFDAPYWDYARKNELRLQLCRHCAQFRYPPGPVCPECLCEESDWTPLGGRGRVVTWTIFRRQYFPEMPVPYTVVSVASQEGPLLIGNFVNGEVGMLRINLPVRAVFENVEFAGETWRICQWEPDAG